MSDWTGFFTARPDQRCPSASRNSLRYRFCELLLPHPRPARSPAILCLSKHYMFICGNIVIFLAVAHHFPSMPKGLTAEVLSLALEGLTAIMDTRLDRRVGRGTPAKYAPSSQVVAMCSRLISDLCAEGLDNGGLTSVEGQCLMKALLPAQFQVSVVLVPYFNACFSPFAVRCLQQVQALYARMFESFLDTRDSSLCHQSGDRAWLSCVHTLNSLILLGSALPPDLRTRVRTLVPTQVWALKQCRFTFYFVF